MFIEPNCGIYTARYPIDKDIRNKGIEYAYPITIGNDVWIGVGVIILLGVKIANNVVVGVVIVVNKDISSNCIALENPCKVSKRINEN